MPIKSTPSFPIHLQSLLLLWESWVASGGGSPLRESEVHTLVTCRDGGPAQKGDLWTSWQKCCETGGTQRPRPGTDGTFLTSERASYQGLTEEAANLLEQQLKLRIALMSPPTVYFLILAQGGGNWTRITWKNTPAPPPPPCPAHHHQDCDIMCESWARA